MLHLAGRSALITLAAGAVIGVTYWATPPAIPKPARDHGPRMSQAEAIPGGEQAVRRAIDDMRKGTQRPQNHWMMTALGPLQTLSYRSADNRGDHYLASFQNGALLWNVSIDEAGKIKTVSFDAPMGPSPQDWIDNYALTATGPRVLVQVIALIKILALVGIGRLARIRL